MLDDISPQQIVFQTIKTLILKLHELIRELNNQHELLEKKMENRSKKITSYILENDAQKREILKEMETLKKNLEEVIVKLTAIDEYLKEKKMQFLFFKKCLKVIKQLPGWLIAFATAMSALLTYFFSHFVP